MLFYSIHVNYKQNIKNITISIRNIQNKFKNKPKIVQNKKIQNKL